VTETPRPAATIAASGFPDWESMVAPDLGIASKLLPGPRRSGRVGARVGARCRSGSAAAAAAAVAAFCARDLVSPVAFHAIFDSALVSPAQSTRKSRYIRA
jgi:hypothetical protein